MTAMMTSSCLCGAAKLSFSLGSDQIVAKVNHLFLPRLRRPLPPPNLTLHKPYPKPTNIPPPPQFLCHCTEDRKITGSMFATNLILVLKTPLYANSPPQQAPTLHPFRQTRPPPKSSPLAIPSPVPTTNTPAPSSHAHPAARRLSTQRDISFLPVVRGHYGPHLIGLSRDGRHQDWDCG